MRVWTILKIHADQSRKKNNKKQKIMYKSGRFSCIDLKKILVFFVLLELKNSVFNSF